jgi:CheY-like chemotaxis protein
MSKYGPILIVEDDIDDQHVYGDVIRTFKRKNELIFFSEGQQLLDYLMTTHQQPFIIICDVNLPEMTGLELRRKLNENEFIKRKSIPFVFFSTSENKEAVREAYDLTVQGYFVKSPHYEEIVNQLRLILDYWTTCKHPSKDN